MQTEYSLYQAVAFRGMIADNSPIKDIETGIAAAGPVFMGRVVTKGAADGLIVHPDAAAEITDEKVVKGVVVHMHDVESMNDGLDPHYPEDAAVPVMRKGRVWVKAEDVITEGSSTVNVRYAAGAGGTQLGSLRGASVSMETAVLPKSKWKSSTSGAGQLAVLEIDL